MYLGKAAQGKARTNNLKRGEATLPSDQSQRLRVQAVSELYYRKGAYKYPQYPVRGPGTLGA